MRPWHRPACRCSRRGVGEDLQRDLPIELRVGRLPDLAHPALTNEGGDVVVADGGSRCQSHWSVRLTASREKEPLDPLYEIVAIRAWYTDAQGDP